MHNKSITLAPVTFLMLISGLVSADTLQFNNGDRLTGKLVREENGTIYFKSDILGEISLPVSAAKLHIESEGEGDAPESATIEESATPEPGTSGEETRAPTPSAKRKRRLPYVGKMAGIFSFIYPLKLHRFGALPRKIGRLLAIVPFAFGLFSASCSCSSLPESSGQSQGVSRFCALSASASFARPL